MHLAFSQNQEEISKINSIYQDMAAFVDKNPDAKILTKINDITSFLTRSIEDLELITKDRPSA